MKDGKPRSMIFCKQLLNASILGANLIINRCMEHSLHLAAKHFVQAVAPSSPQKVAQKIKHVLQKAQVNGDVDLHEPNKEFIGFSFDDGGSGDENNSDEDDCNDTNFNAGDSLGKAQALVNQASFNIFYSYSIAKKVLRSRHHHKHMHSLTSHVHKLRSQHSNFSYGSELDGHLSTGF